jgi:uncharacterized protein (TIGR02996 family)
MSDEAALYAAILAQPDEDTPRLVYADWLDEHGGEAGRARAEFIRLQIEDMREGLSERRRKVIRGRCAALEKEHGAEWREPFNAARGNRWVTGAFHRGFVSRAHDSGVAPSWYPAVAAVCPIQELEFGGVYIPDTEANAVMAACPALARVRRIGYRNLPVALAESVFPSPHLTGLSSLSVEHGPPDALEVLDRSPASSSLRQLRYRVSADENLADRPGLRRFLSAGWPALADLRLERGTDDEGVRLLAAHFSARGATTLSAWDDRLTVAGARAAIEAALPGRLGTLALTQWGHRSEHELGTHQLRLEGFDGGGDALVAWLVSVLPPGRFTRLTLVRCGIGRVGARALTGWAGLAHLKELDLSHNEIGDTGAVHLAEAPDLEHVERLIVIANQLGKRGSLALKRRFGRRARLS